MADKWEELDKLMREIRARIRMERKAKKESKR